MKLSLIVLIVVGFLGAFQGEVAWAAAPQGRELGVSGPFVAFGELVEIALRSPGSATECDGLLREIGATAQGYALLPTASFFPEKVVQEVFYRFPAPATIILVGSDAWEPGLILAEATSQKVLTPTQLYPFTRYLEWLLENINRALPTREKVEMTSAELRVSQRGSVTNSFPQWHQDGGYLAAAVSLLGQGTDYRTDSPAGLAEMEGLEARYAGTAYERSPRGYTLVFSGTDRLPHAGVAPTVHRSPKTDTDRLFLIVRYRLARR